MVNRSDEMDAARQSLSALMDGQLGATDANEPCAAWRGSAEARECWHSYHLIGDVLRSSELASSPARDAAFLQALRGKLAQEPVPLAPSVVAPAVPSVDSEAVAVAAVVAAIPQQAVAGRRMPRWLAAPVAVAAGFVAVAGVLVVTRVATPDAAGNAGTATLAAGSQADRPADVKVVNGQLIRNAQLDRYLAAHRQVSNGFAVHVPATAARNVDAVVLESK